MAEGRGLLPFRGYLWPPGHSAVIAAALSTASDAPLRHQLAALYEDLNARPPLTSRIPIVFTLVAASPGVFLLKVLQVLVSTLSVWLVFRIGHTLFGPRTGFLAALLFAFTPELVAFTHYLWNETIYIALLLGAAALLFEDWPGSAGPDRLRSHRGSASPAPAAGFSAPSVPGTSTAPDPRDDIEAWAPPRAAMLRLLGAGLLFGLAALFKGIALYIVVLASLALAARAGRGAKTARGRARVVARLPAACLLGGALVVVLPWSAAVSRSQGRPVLLEATLGKNLRIGNNPAGPSNWDWGSPPIWDPALTECGDENVVDRDRCEARLALGYVRDHPFESVLRVAPKLADLLTPTSFLIRQVRAGAYGVPSAALVRGITLLSVLPYVAVMLLGLAGWVLAPHGPGRTALIGYLLFLLVIHAATFGMSRFRLPLMPVPILFSAYALAEGRARLRARVLRSRRARLAVASLLGALLLIAWASRWGRVFDVFASQTFARTTVDHERVGRGLPGAAAVPGSGAC